VRSPPIPIRRLTATLGSVDFSVKEELRKW
jgi:hypothetical protein